MKKNLIIFFAFMIVCTLSSLAQKRDKKEKNNIILEHSAELNLSAEQIEMIKKIRSENLEKNKELKEKQKAISEEIRANNSEMKNQIKEVLTPEQLEKLRTVIKDSIQLKRKERKEVAKEIKEYSDINIKPVILTKRNEFDKKLNIEEKKIIAEYIAKHKAFKDSKFMETDADPELIKEKKQSLHRETAAAMRPIIENHKAELEKIFEELKPEFEKWQNDIKKIKEKHGNSDIDKKREGKKNVGFNKKNAAIKFLLNNFEEK